MSRLRSGRLHASHGSGAQNQVAEALGLAEAARLRALSARADPAVHSIYRHGEPNLAGRPARGTSRGPQPRAPTPGASRPAEPEGPTTSRARVLPSRCARQLLRQPPRCLQHNRRTDFEPEFKSRLVGCGNFEDATGVRTDAPTSDLETRSIVAAFAVAEGVPPQSSDIRNEYFQALPIDRIVIMRQPSGGLPGVDPEAEYPFTDSVTPAVDSGRR